MSINDPAEFLEQLAAEVASLNDRLDAAGIASLEALLTPQSTEPRIGAVSTPTASIGGGDVTQTAVLAPSSVVTDSIASGAITMPKIAANAVDMTKFAQAIIPPRVVLELPTLPDDNYPVGSIVFLTSDETLYKNVAGTWTATTEADLVANTLYAGAITAGAIGARELATVILLSSLIKTANSGARVEIDVNGIRCIASDNTLLVNIPTDPDEDVYVRAEVRALGLLVYDNAVFQGAANVLAAGSSTSLENAIANPSVPAVISGGIKTKSVSFAGRGLAYDTAGGAGGATTVWWTARGGPITAGTPTLYEILDSDGTTNRSLDISAQFSSGWVYGVAVLGSYVYVIGKLSTAWRVCRYTKSSLTLDTTYSSVTWPIATPVSPTITSDGTNLYIADVASSTRYLSWYKYDAVMATVGSIVNTGVAPWGPVFTPGGLYVGSGDFGAVRVLVCGWNGSPTSVFAFDDTGARQTGSEWTRDGGDAGGIAYDGTYFHISKEGTVLNKYSGITATGEWWFKYTWYDSDTTGGTHETALSPVNSALLVNARRFFDITTPTEPGGGGTDDPDGRRIYAVQSGTTPADSSYKLQVATADETWTMGSFASGGAAPPTSNNFPGGTAAVLKSAGGEWQLEGDGTAAFGAVAITGDITGVPLTGSDTVFTITGGGGATYTSKNCEYVKIGRLVVFNLRWVVNAAGSGTTALSITSEDTGLPKAAGSFVAMGDHGGSGANRILARMQNGTNELTVLNIAEVGAPTTNETGAELLAGSTWSIMGAYISES